MRRCARLGSADRLKFPSSSTGGWVYVGKNSGFTELEHPLRSVYASHCGATVANRTVLGHVWDDTKRTVIEQNAQTICFKRAVALHQLGKRSPTTIQHSSDITHRNGRACGYLAPTADVHNVTCV